MGDRASRHKQTVVDQFSKQADHFAKLPGHAEADALFVRMAEVGPGDEVLDVACGPGLVACAVAPYARRVTGIDLTPAMIERARALQAERGLANLDWLVGDVTPLPFPGARFSVVLTRYSFHHFLDPRAVLAEMVRVCRPGGRVLVADLALPAEKAEAYDRVERLRDPSHVRVLAEAELVALLAEAGLCDVRRSGYAFEVGLEQLLQRSFPDPGDAGKVRAAFEADAGVDKLGVGAYRSGDEVRIVYPIAVFVGRRPA
jgi:ubiquinone/menaquinone biosynthesis C-methylase UbiE